MGSTNESNISIETCMGLDDCTTNYGVTMDIETRVDENDQTVGDFVKNE